MDFRFGSKTHFHSLGNRMHHTSTCNSSAWCPTEEGPTSVIDVYFWKYRLPARIQFLKTDSIPNDLSSPSLLDLQSRGRGSRSPRQSHRCPAVWCACTRAPPARRRKLKLRQQSATWRYGRSRSLGRLRTNPLTDEKSAAAAQRITVGVYVRDFENCQ